MLDVSFNREVTVKISPEIETRLGEVCVAVKHLDECLNMVGFGEAYRYGPHANFHTYEVVMPDMSLGELVSWLNNFACVEGPELARQEPTGEALVTGRARQFYAMLKPLAARISEIAADPSHRGQQPFLFSVLAHPKVYWAFDELCSRLGSIAR